MKLHFNKAMGILVASALMAQAVVPNAALVAKKKAPSLSSKSVSVDEGASKKVSVKNAKGYKITSVKSGDSDIASVKKKGNLAFAVKGVKAGKTKFTCIVKKKKVKKTLKGSITVKGKTQSDTNIQPAASAAVPSASAKVSAAPVAPSAAPSAPAATQTAAPVKTKAPAKVVPTPLMGKIDFVYQAPKGYNQNASSPAKDKCGTMDTIEYDSETYDDKADSKSKSVKVKKQARIYLPAGYDKNDKNKKYNVLYLMHGGGEDMGSWLDGSKYGDYPKNRIMVDNLINNGVIDPLIIVMPTFYRPEGVSSPSDSWLLTELFQYELRNDLIPYIDSHYNTYANGDTSEENLKKTRMHRAFVGFSMGSQTTYQSALYPNYDLIAWFGPLSGNFARDGEEAEVNKIVSVLEDGAKNNMPLGFLYCGNGKADMAHDGQVSIMNKVCQKTDILKEGENYAFIDLPDLGKDNIGGHDMWSWHVHLYNILRVFFKE